MTQTRAYLICVTIAAVILLLLSESARASSNPAARGIWGESTPEMMSELSFQTETKDPDAYLLSFHDWRFQVDYVKSGIKPESVYLDDFERGIYTSGPLNWRMNFSILQVFEFKNSGEVSFGPEDTVMSTVDVIGQNCSLFARSENTPNWGVRNTHTILSEDGLITLVCVTDTDYIAYDLNGDTDPTEIKLNIRISRYSFANDSDSLGLRVKVSALSSSGILYAETPNGGSLNITTQEAYAGGLIEWNGQAVVDGVASPPWEVGSSWDGENLTMAYPKGNTIMHDIIFKVRSNLTYYTDLDSLDPDPVVYVVGLGIAASAIAATVFYIKRSRTSRKH